MCVREVKEFLRFSSMIDRTQRGWCALKTLKRVKTPSQYTHGRLTFLQAGLCGPSQTVIYEKLQSDDALCALILVRLNFHWFLARSWEVRLYWWKHEVDSLIIERFLFPASLVLVVNPSRTNFMMDFFDAFLKWFSEHHSPDDVCFYFSASLPFFKVIRVSSIQFPSFGCVGGRRGLPKTTSSCDEQFLTQTPSKLLLFESFEWFERRFEK